MIQNIFLNKNKCYNIIKHLTDNDDNFGQGFRCKVCRRTLYSRKSFLKHVLAHSSGSAGSSSTGINVSSNGFNGKRDAVCRFKCEQCDYRALDRSRLIRHMRRHTGERPFPCDLCSYKATQSSSLARHRRQHTGERPYHCDLCDYRASQATTLNTHRLKHSRDRILYCGRCDYKTVLVHNMEEHKRVVHEDSAGVLASSVNDNDNNGVGQLDIVGTVDVGELIQVDSSAICENL